MKSESENSIQLKSENVLGPTEASEEEQKFSRAEKLLPCKLTSLST
jgi:hypothetical protein